MPPQIATVVFVLGILGLFWLDRDREARISKALWIPVLWLLIIGSRGVSQWLQTGPTFDPPDKYLEGSPLDAYVFGTLLVAALIVLVGRRRQVGLFLRANGPILLFFFYCALSTLWSDYTFVAFKRWIKAVGDLMMVLIVLTDLEPTAALKRLLARVGFLLVPVSVLLVKYYPDLGRDYNRWTWTSFYEGVATSKNGLGIVCLLFGVGSVWRLCGALRAKDDPHRMRHLMAQGALFAMVMWLFWMTNSVTSLSCFLMASLLLVATSLRALARKTRVVHVLVAAMLFVSFSALFLNVGSDLVETMGRDATLTGRTVLWKVVLGMTGNPLFGTGFESFWLGPRLEKIWSIYFWHPNEAHNGYIEIYLTLGWVGIGLLALLLVTGYLHALTEFRREPDTGSLKVAYFAITVAYNCTESAIKVMHPVWVFFLLATLAVPEPAASEAPLPLGVNHADGFAESESQYDHVLRAGSLQGTH